MADPELSRRDFVKALGTAAVVPWIPPMQAPVGSLDPAQTAVARFYHSLASDQKTQICFPFDHPLRLQLTSNRAIAWPTIDSLTAEQRTLCHEILGNLCSADGHARFLRQMEDDSGGFERYHVAVFGEPGADRRFEWVVTGRHATLRADGNPPAGASFRGPIFYGHAARTGNVWQYQAEQAAAIFAALDASQKARALGSRSVLDAGLSVAELESAQKAMVQLLVRGLLQPFRIAEGDELLSYLRDPQAADMLRLTCYQDRSIGSKGLPDIWKLEGPAFSWYFHGTPHVHAWLDVAQKKAGRQPIG